MNIWRVMDKHFNRIRHGGNNHKHAMAVFGHMGPLFTFSCSPMDSRDSENLPLRRCYYNFTRFWNFHHPIADNRSFRGDAYIDRELVLL
jgi:hypothetical protein